MATSTTSLRRKRTAFQLLSVAAYCLAVASGQDGSHAGSAGVTSTPTLFPPLFPTPTPSAAPQTTAPPSTSAPTTTLAPTPTPTPTSAKPTSVPSTTAPTEPEDTTPVTPSPEPTTEPPSVTPKPSKTKKNATEVADVPASLTADAAAPDADAAAAAERSSSTADLSPAATPGSGVSYGGKTTDSSQSSEATTKSAKDSSSSAIQFVVVAAGALGVVGAIAMSVHFVQKRRALDRDYEEDDKYLEPVPKRPTVIDVHEPTTTKPAPAATLYNNYSTPQASGWGQRTVAAPPVPAVEKPTTKYNIYSDSADTMPASMPSPNPLNDSTATGIVTTAATSGASATFVSRNGGENDVSGDEDDERVTQVGIHGYEQEDFREPRVTVKHITRCRGQSEASLAEDDNLSQYGAQGLLRSTFIDDEDEGYTNTQMFAFSDSGSEADRDSSRSDQSRGPAGASSDVSEFLKYYNGPIVAPQAAAGVDVDVDVDGYDEEDIIGRSTRASSLADDVRASDFTVGHTSRMSTSSSIADFHDSTVDRPSELDDEEFEV